MLLEKLDLLSAKSERMLKKFSIQAQSQQLASAYLSLHTMTETCLMQKKDCKDQVVKNTQHGKEIEQLNGLIEQKFQVNIAEYIELFESEIIERDPDFITKSQTFAKRMSSYSDKDSSLGLPMEKIQARFEQIRRILSTE